MKLELTDNEVRALVAANPAGLEKVCRRAMFALRAKEKREAARRQYYRRMLIEMGYSEAAIKMQLPTFRTLTPREHTKFTRWADTHPKEEYKGNIEVLHPVVRYRWHVNAINQKLKGVSS